MYGTESKHDILKRTSYLGWIFRKFETQSFLLTYKKIHRVFSHLHARVRKNITIWVGVEHFLKTMSIWVKTLSWHQASLLPQVPTLNCHERHQWTFPHLPSCSIIAHSRLSQSICGVNRLCNLLLSLDSVYFPRMPSGFKDRTSLARLIKRKQIPCSIKCGIIHEISTLNESNLAFMNFEGAKMRKKFLLLSLEPLISPPVPRVKTSAYQWAQTKENHRRGHWMKLRFPLNTEKSALIRSQFPRLMFHSMASPCFSPAWPPNCMRKKELIFQATP